MHLFAQGGSLEYHMQSLRNLQEAVKRARRLCAVMVDTLGRELTIRRNFKLDDQVSVTGSHQTWAACSKR